MDEAELVKRHCSRRQPIDASFLNARLEGAKSYDRIAGYFSSSILEIVGEALERVHGRIRVVCNSRLSRADVEVAKVAQAEMRREWCDSQPEYLGDTAKPRFKRLYGLLRSGKMEIRVLPDEVFGLIHGKAGVITLADGRQTSFLGSANESKTAFRLNYELLWEDDSPEVVAWVQEEFDALWTSPFAVRLADFIVEDIDRLSLRELIPEISQWREEPEPASAVVEDAYAPGRAIDACHTPMCPQSFDIANVSLEYGDDELHRPPTSSEHRRLLASTDLSQFSCRTQ